MAHTTHETMQAASSHTVRFLGTGASCGVPSYYCGCKACEEALRNPAAQRGCACLLVKGSQNTLIDASPDLRMQLAHARAKEIHQVLFTHEHFDHIGGIPQLEYYVRLVSKVPLPFYAGKHTIAAINEQFAFMNDTFTTHEIESYQSLEFDGVRYTALPAAHGTQTFGFIIEKVKNADNLDVADSGDITGGMGGTADAGGAGEADGATDVGATVVATAANTQRRIAYFPDTTRPSQEVLDKLKNIDVLIIDASFNGSNWMPASHLSIDEAIALAQELGAKKTFLTHLTMHYDEPITAHELQQKLAPYGGAILAANDGLEIPL